MRKQTSVNLVAMLLVGCVLSAACGSSSDLIVGVATSVGDTGLIDELAAEFEEHDSGVGNVKPIGAGSGQLEELARRGEVDVIISHAPESEVRLIADGFGVDRRPFMHNFFLVVGPEDDPAGVAVAASTIEAFRLIAEAEADFLSRSDLSGTNQRELRIWEEAGIDPTGRSWYQESGAGQGTSLLVASDKDAYTLVDSGTWAVLEEQTGLTAFVSDEAPNVYSVIRVNPERHSVNEEAAAAFAEFLTSATAQALIGEFGLEEFGVPLFLPGTPADAGAYGPVSTR